MTFKNRLLFRLKVLSVILIVGVIFYSENSFSDGSENPEKKELSCFWMENTSGKFLWVPAASLGVHTKEECFAADSCDDGKGESKGGCYKWAATADAKRESWN